MSHKYGFVGCGLHTCVGFVLNNPNHADFSVWLLKFVI